MTKRPKATPKHRPVKHSNNKRAVIKQTVTPQGNAIKGNAINSVANKALRPTGIDGVSISGEPEIAGAGVRVVAIVYDGMLILALLFIMGTVLTVIGTFLTMETGVTSSEAQTLPQWYQNLVMTPAFILTLIGFYGLFWRRAGQTLGMQTWRLKTVTSTGKLLTWAQSVKRILAACVVPILCGVVGVLWHGSRSAMLVSAFFGLLFNYAFCWFNQKGLAVHDILSNTVTLKMPKIHHQSLIKSFRKKPANKTSTEDSSAPSSKKP